ncbi:Uncharacterised protein (plasmid) [Mesomycoplasma neurolyticum]|uniref:Uncharacterized protein n=1 Tax=Mesomycoplasma neurolyticum TaxID=2120 RepID=A0A449A6D6_9BACT|nr:Uncharacterised protein [Mesomycoplasma neurolyticum]
MPENLFITQYFNMYLVARKNKPSNEKGIFMINATKEFEASKRQNI